MNTRQKKKRFKKVHGENPPKWMELCGERLRIRTPKLIRQQKTGNLKVFIEVMTERRKKCRKRS
ncbi:MAG: hypothetical protein ACLTX6_11410 [Lachnospiraceae bacterium]